MKGDERHGVGTFIDKDGKARKCLWENDELVKWLDEDIQGNSGIPTESADKTK